MLVMNYCKKTELSFFFIPSYVDSVQGDYLKVEIKYITKSTSPKISYWEEN